MTFLRPFLNLLFTFRSTAISACTRSFTPRRHRSRRSRPSGRSPTSTRKAGGCWLRPGARAGPTTEKRVLKSWSRWRCGLVPCCCIRVRCCTAPGSTPRRTPRYPWRFSTAWAGSAKKRIRSSHTRRRSPRRVNPMDPTQNATRTRVHVVQHRMLSWASDLC